MKTTKLLVIATLLLLSIRIEAQVSIGGPIPDGSAQLDLIASNRGLLIPRVQLLSTTDNTTITNGNVNSLMVYATQALADITPGFYFWQDTRWLRITDSAEIGGVLTTFGLNSDGFTLEYRDENSTLNTVDLAAVINNFESVTSLKINTASNTLEYIDEDNVTNSLDISALIANLETISTLENNSDGTFTYTDESGKTTQINASTLETLTSLSLNADNVNLDYTDENGVTTQINLPDLVANLETTTTIVDNLNGSFTYTDEEGDTTVINASTPETVTSLSLSGDILGYIDENTTLNTFNLGAVIDAKSWSLKGNSLTDSTKDFIGTTDFTALSFGTNGVIKWKIASNGIVDGLSEIDHLIPSKPGLQDLGTAVSGLRTGYFKTSIFNPLLIGGLGVNSSLTLRSTAGIGEIGADIIFEIGNDVATEAMRILNSGNIGIGTNTPNEKLEVDGKVRISDLTGTNFDTDVVVTADANTGELKHLSATTAAKLVFSAEYSGATLSADGLNNTLNMNANNSRLSPLPFMNYYEASNFDTDGGNNDYDVVLRLTLPEDFVSWSAAPAAMVIYFEGTKDASFKADVYQESGELVINKKKEGDGLGTFTENTIATATDLTGLTAGKTLIIFIKLMVLDITIEGDSIIRIGDIVLNYNKRRF
jgi:hypothetical protein